MAFTITDNCVGCALCGKICPVACIDGKPRKRHRIDPVRCIDCGACGRVCPHDAVRDPKGHVAKRVRFRKTWEKPVIRTDRCMSCNICIDACPVQCLALAYTAETDDTSVFPVLKKPHACIACGFCAEDCPVEAIAMVPPAAE